MLQLLFITIGGAACIGAGVRLLGTLTGFTYRYLPTAGALNDYRKKLAEFHIQSGKAPLDADVAADLEVMQYITGLYASYADHNTRNNDAKSASLNNANWWIIVALFFTVAAGAFFVANSIASSAAQKFE